MMLADSQRAIVRVARRPTRPRETRTPWVVRRTPVPEESRRSVRSQLVARPARLGHALRHSTHPGGDERTRTADPLLAKQVLYQLSYVPSLTCENSVTEDALVGATHEMAPRRG